MSTNTALDQIKARVEGHTEGPWKAWNDAPAHRSAYVETTWAHEGDEPVQITDWCLPADAELIAAAPKLLAALEAVEALLEGKYQLYAAVCGETCCKDILGVDHEAIADNVAANIRQAITDALA